jgi:hypothetical protein
MADKLRRPLNAPPGITPTPGVQPGVNQGVVIATRVIVVGPAGTVTGVFVYAPGTTPGPGNFPTAWMTTATTDPFGNVLPVAAVIGTTSIYAADGVFFSTGGAAGAAVVPNGSGGVNIQTTGGQYVDITTGPFASVAGTAADPTIITTDTWHTPALGADFGYQSGAAKLSYQLGIDNRVKLDGVVALSAGFANPLFTIPAAYRPPGLVGFSVGVFGAVVATGAPYCSITAAGAVQLTDVPAAATAVLMSGSYPLDIPVD